MALLRLMLISCVRQLVELLTNFTLVRKKSIFDFALCTSDGTDASGNIGEGCNANTEITK